MAESPRIYLDHAATSWPRPDRVLEAMDDYARQCGAAAGRGSYHSAQQAAQVIRQLRRQLANLIGAESADSISLHPSGTLALNAAIQGLVRPGDHVVTTTAEHNSVLRPLHFLQTTRDVQLTVVDCDQQGVVSPQGIRDAVTAETRLVAVNHASNVTGEVQPVAEIKESMKGSNALLLCDAAQTLGYIPVDVGVLGIDILAAPGHKGAYGPMGTGMLYVAPELQQQIVPFIHGGTGSQSESLEMPTTYPDKLEAGNLNVAALAGWSAGLETLLEIGIDSVEDLSEKLHGELRSIAGIRLVGRPGQLAIASLVVDGFPTADLAAILDAEFRIETRSGYHCAALIHRCLNTNRDGTLRISGGHQTFDDEIDSVCEALREIVAEIQ